ncbi:MAG: HDOD domain-containing protein [Thermodesulfobacteriota bacterium]|nr:HDOD domain-containing protein [Thermodesulfobacteriota bacterium]
MGIDILERIKDIDDLATLPSIGVEVMEKAESPDVSIREISEIIHRDPALSARVLKIAHSPIYRRASQHIDTIQKAIMVLGLNEIVNLAATISVLDSFSKRQSPHEEGIRTAFWNHCMATAIIARRLCLTIGMRLQGRDFTGGLLHDIGKLILYEHFHDQFVQAYNISMENNCPMYESELHIMGTTHMEVGQYLAKRWNLPSFLQDIIRFHHDPDRAEHTDLVSLISISNLLAKAKQFACGGDHISIILADQPAWRLMREHGYPMEDLDMERITFEMDDLGAQIKEYISSLSDHQTGEPVQ